MLPAFGERARTVAMCLDYAGFGRLFQDGIGKLTDVLSSQPMWPMRVDRSRKHCSSMSKIA
jgi:hypothetical protein